MLCRPDFAVIVTFKVVDSGIKKKKTFPGSLFGTIEEQAGTNLLANVHQWKGLSTKFLLGKYCLSQQNTGVCGW